jgi:hypothetical protein
MVKEAFAVGDKVVLFAEGWKGVSGVVSRPIAMENTGHVLVHMDGYISGVEVSLDQIEPADETSQGFAQLAYNLIKIGSHVIEQTLM